MSQVWLKFRSFPREGTQFVLVFMFLCSKCLNDGHHCIAAKICHKSHLSFLQYHTVVHKMVNYYTKFITWSLLCCDSSLSDSSLNI